MSRAAFDLQNSSEKISDIALKYGYESPTAFNRPHPLQEVRERN